MKKLLLVLAVLALTASTADAARAVARQRTVVRGGNRGAVVRQRTVVRGGFGNAAFVNRGFGFNSFAFATPFVFTPSVVAVQRTAVIATPSFGFAAAAIDPCGVEAVPVNTFGSSFAFRSRSAFIFR